MKRTTNRPGARRLGARRLDCFEMTTGKGAAAMRASVGNGVEAALDVEEGHLFPIDHNDAGPSWLEVPYF